MVLWQSRGHGDGTRGASAAKPQRRCREAGRRRGRRLGWTWGKRHCAGCGWRRQAAGPQTGVAHDGAAGEHTHRNASAGGSVLPMSTWPESCKRRATVWPNASWDPRNPTSTNARFHGLPCSTWRMAANTHRMHAQVSARLCAATVAAFSVSVCTARLKRANACVPHGCSSHAIFAGTKW